MTSRSRGLIVAINCQPVYVKLVIYIPGVVACDSGMRIGGH